MRRPRQEDSLDGESDSRYISPDQHLQAVLFMRAGSALTVVLNISRESEEADESKRGANGEMQAIDSAKRRAGC